MQILECGREHRETLLFFPCTAEPVWAFADTIAVLSQRWHIFSGGVRRSPAGISGRLYFRGADCGRGDPISECPRHFPFGCCLRLLSGRCVSDPFAGLGEISVGRAIIDGGMTPYRLPFLVRKLLLARDVVLQNGGKATVRCWKRHFRRNGLLRRGMTAGKSIMRWSGTSKPSRTGRSGTYSGLPTITLCRKCLPNAAQNHLLVRLR